MIGWHIALRVFEVDPAAHCIGRLPVGQLQRNCKTEAVASWAGDRPDLPSRGHHSTRSSSFHSPSSRSRIVIATVPSWLHARAIRAVISRIGAAAVG